MTRWSRREAYKRGIPQPSGLSGLVSNWRRQVLDEATVQRRLAIISEFRERIDDERGTSGSNDSDSETDQFMNQGKTRKQRQDRFNKSQRMLYEDIISGPSNPKTIADKTYTELNEAYFKSLFLIPWYLVEIPEDFHELNWLISIRPEGSIAHCIIRNGRAIIRGKSGKVLRWAHVGHMPQNTTILYGIYDNGRFHIFDMLMWNNLSLCEIETTHRLEFASSRLSERELFSTPPTKTPSMKRREAARMKQGGVSTSGLELINGMDSWRVATKKSFEELYETAERCLVEGRHESGGHLDGLWFLHRSSFHLPGLSPFLLHYKDQHICRWPIDTAPHPNPETGEYEPAESMRIRLWVSKHCTNNPHFMGADEDQEATVASNPDIAYTGEGVPVLQAEGLSDFLGHSDHGILHVKVSDQVHLTGNSHSPLELNDVQILETNRSKKFESAKICQSCDADSLSKIVYLGRARLAHFQGIDNVISSERIYDSLCDDEEN